MHQATPQHHLTPTPAPQLATYLDPLREVLCSFPCGGQGSVPARRASRDHVGDPVCRHRAHLSPRYTWGCTAAPGADRALGGWEDLGGALCSAFHGNLRIKELIPNAHTEVIALLTAICQ